MPFGRGEKKKIRHDRRSDDGKAGVREDRPSQESSAKTTTTTTTTTTTKGPAQARDEIAMDAEETRPMLEEDNEKSSPEIDRCVQLGDKHLILVDVENGETVEPRDSDTNFNENAVKDDDPSVNVSNQSNSNADTETNTNAADNANKGAGAAALPQQRRSVSRDPSQGRKSSTVGGSATAGSGSAAAGAGAGAGAAGARKSSAAKELSEEDQVKMLNSKTDRITGKMRDNLDELMKRDVKLDDLEETAGTLAEDAKQFHTNSKKIDRKMWWKNQKMNIIIGAVVVVAVVGITLGIAGGFGAFKG